MTTSVSYVVSRKYTKTLAVGAATPTAPLIIVNDIPMHYSIDSWNAAAVDILKCSVGAWDGFNYTKLLQLTAAEKYMKYDFMGLLTSAATSTDIQAFLDSDPSTIAIAYSAGANGVETNPAEILVHVTMSAFKYT